MSKPFLSDSPWNFAHVFNVPICRAFYECFCFCFCFFRQTFGCSYFGDIWVLRDPTFPAKKNKNPKRLGRGTLNTCAKIQGLSLKNGVDIWTFVRLSAKTTAWHRNYLVLVYIRFWAKIDLILVLRSQFFHFLCDTLRRHAMEHPEAPGTDKKGCFFFFLQ